MSKDLWKPEGNQAQTEIDLQLERCRFLRRKAESALSDLLSELELTIRNVKEIDDHLFLLRESISIVSMKEYSLLKSKSSSLSSSIRLIDKEIVELGIYIQKCNDKISDLQIEKEKLASKILEFKSGKRKRRSARK